jgi:hypothetical protein
MSLLRRKLKKGHCMRSEEVELKRNSVQDGAGQRFVNGWFCVKCDCVTEHRNIYGREICKVCGTKKGVASKKPYQSRTDYCTMHKGKMLLHRVEHKRHLQTEEETTF